jgi:hypothetical protein
MHSTHLSSLVEQHRFLRAVCTFHSQSENDTMLPVALRFAVSHTEVRDSPRSLCIINHIQPIPKTLSMAKVNLCFVGVAVYPGCGKHPEM